MGPSTSRSRPARRHNDRQRRASACRRRSHILVHPRELPSKANECLGSLRDAQGRLKRFEESVGFFGAEPIARLRVVVDKHDERLTPGFGRFLLWIVLYAKASHQRSGRLGLRSRRSPRTTPTNASLLSRAGPPVRAGTRRLSTRAIDGKPFMRAFLPRTTRGYAPTTMGVKLASPGTRKLSAVRSGRTITPLASMLLPCFSGQVNRFGSSRTAV